MIILHEMLCKYRLMCFFFCLLPECVTGEEILAGSGFFVSLLLFNLFCNIGIPNFFLNVIFVHNNMFPLMPRRPTPNV